MSEQTPSGLEQLTPKQIVANLMPSLARTTAFCGYCVANRWRRMQLSEELRDGQPKNILMIVNVQTEIARRLAKLARALL